ALEQSKCASVPIPVHGHLNHKRPEFSWASSSVRSSADVEVRRNVRRALYGRAWPLRGGQLNCHPVPAIGQKALTAGQFWRYSAMQLHSGGRMSVIGDYLSRIQTVAKSGKATEHSYRSAIEFLFHSLDGGVTALNEPKRVECGAPDFIIE